MPGRAGINAIVLCNKLILLQDSGVRAMPWGLAHFIKKNLRNLTLFCSVEHVASYISAFKIEKHLKILVNIIHSFLSVYTNCKQPRKFRGYKYRIKALVPYIK